jgi:hypothetical protein
MKTMKLAILLSACCISSLVVHGQGTFFYDQESSTIDQGGGSVAFQSLSPYGQSFTPMLSSIGFVQLQLTDKNSGKSLGGTLVVNLRSDSITGTILGSTTPLLLSDGFSGLTTFLSSTAVALTPETIYYLEPIVQSGDQWTINAGEYNYPGGMVFGNGGPAPASDVWFREGIVVPEPSSLALLLLGCGLFVSRRQFHQ